MRVTNNHHLTVNALAVLFLPGTIIHELAHLLVAGILMVPVGDLEVLPEVDGDSVKLGSVQVAQSDPIRQTLIGVAPILVGLLAIVGLVFFNKEALLTLSPAWLVALVIYLIFEITNTMFSSKKDIEGTIGFVVGVVVVVLGLGLTLYFTGFLPTFWGFLTKIDFSWIVDFLIMVDKFLLLPIILDLSLLGIFGLLSHRR